MKIVVYCFSGTGNTKRVCEALSEELRKRGHEADVFAIRAGAELPSPEGYGCLIVGYPVHAFNAPAPVLKFLKKLPKRKGEKMPAYLVRTSGEPLGFNEASGVLPRRILKKRGYEVRGEFRYVMPYNIIFRHSDGMAARMKEAASVSYPLDADAISEGRGEIPRRGPIRRFVSFVLRVEHPAMPFIGRRFKATEKCVGCGLCAKICPQGNIEMVNGRPKFGKSCAACMGCSFACPKDAIKISLLNGWRVNGAYSFEGEPATDDEVCSYCRKSYLKYFHAAEEGKR